jgi:hypothetical protein
MKWNKIGIFFIIFLLISSIGCISDDRNHKSSNNITHEIIIEVDDLNFLDIFEDSIYYSDMIGDRYYLYSLNVNTREKKKILEISDIGWPCSIYKNLIGFSQRIDYESSYDRKALIYNLEDGTTEFFSPDGVKDDDIKIFGDKAVIDRTTLEGQHWSSTIILINLTTKSVENITSIPSEPFLWNQFLCMDFFGKYIGWWSDISEFGRSLVIYNLETKEFNTYFEERFSNNILFKIYGNYLVYLDQSEEILGYLNLETHEDKIISNDYPWYSYDDFDIFEDIIVWISAEINTENDNDHYDLNIFYINEEKNKVILSSPEYKGSPVIYGDNIVFLSGDYGEKMNLIRI